MVLGEGEYNPNGDFGYNTGSATDIQGNTNNGALGDRIWIDSDGDGVQDSNEVSVEGALVAIVGPGAGW